MQLERRLGFLLYFPVQTRPSDFSHPWGLFSLAGVTPSKGRLRSISPCLVNCSLLSPPLPNPLPSLLTSSRKPSHKGPSHFSICPSRPMGPSAPLRTDMLLLLPFCKMSACVKARVSVPPSPRRFSSCSSKSPMSPLGLKPCTCFRYKPLAHHDTWSSHTLHVYVSSLSDWGALKTGLCLFLLGFTFTCLQPQPGTQNRLSPRSAWSGGAGDCEPGALQEARPGPNSLRALPWWRGCSHFVSDVSYPIPTPS